jgi:hypothetical protein
MLGPLSSIAIFPLKTQKPLRDSNPGLLVSCDVHCTNIGTTLIHFGETLVAFPNPFWQDCHAFSIILF